MKPYSEWELKELRRLHELLRQNNTGIGNSIRPDTDGVKNIPCL